MGITVAIRGVDEELYRKVKAYAALEGRTIGSVVNEALRAWLEKRNHPLYEKWRKIKESREKSLRWLEENYDELCSKYGGMYAVVSEGRLIGVFKDFDSAAKAAEKLHSEEAVIIRLGEALEKKVDLGLPADVVGR
ncbi:MAG: hypothetical protein J7J67_02945 [Thermoproteales archaeon]|nr:hypothetical protein [Thermoproteales archaeon]